MTAIDEAVAATDAALGQLQEIVAALGDGDLHRAHRDGGWSVAQVISHVNVCGILWLGDLQRLRDDPDLDFLYREEIGHDALGYAPPTTELAGGQLGATRRTVARSVPAIGDAVGARTVTIPDLGTMTVAEWTPLILGHMASHAQQAIDILTDRDAMPVVTGGAA